MTLESPTEESTLVSGWYGKMPCLGDFASRRLPNDFITPWDAWLQRSIAATRERLRESWLDVYVTSPMWRFILAPEVCGDRAWTGLLIPSVDRVGRYFPLTFALPLGGSTFDIVKVVSQHAWYAELERVALSALSVDFTVDTLEHELAKSPFPRDAANLGDTDARVVAEWLRDPAPGGLAHEFSDAESLAGAIRDSATVVLAASVHGTSFWWSVEQQSAATELHCTRGLPDAECYAALLRAPPAADVLSLDPMQLPEARPSGASD